MKDAHLSVRSFVAALALLLATSFTAKADEAADFLGNLHAFRVSNFIALDAFYRFSANGDTDTLNEIVESINGANSAMNLVTESTADVLGSDDIEGLNKEFDEFKNLMRLNINDVRKNGYPDLRLVSEMAEQAATLNATSSELYSISLESAQISVDNRVEAARSAAVTMAQMMAKYSVRSNLSASQTFQGTSTDDPLDVKAQQFEAFLSEISSGPKSETLRTALDDISSKWLFIKNSYINYNENNVSFVIDRYSKGILEALNNTIGLLQESA